MRLARLLPLALPLLFAAFPSIGFAQDEPKPDELKKMYADALSQLKSVQDRRNELAQANEALTAKVKDLETKLATTNTEALVAQDRAAARSAVPVSTGGGSIDLF